jgi:hypothetical protein
VVYRTSEWLKITSTSNAERILAALGVGKQAEQYKRIKAVLDQMMPKI